MAKGRNLGTDAEAVLSVQWLEQAEYHKSSFWVCSAWRYAHTDKISESKGESGGDFLDGFPKKYYPNLAWRKAP